MKKYSAALFMLALGLISLIIHFILGWQAYVSEASQHQSSAVLSDYLIQWGRDVFENLQSEFIQLAFQMALVAGLFKLIFVKAYEEDIEELKQQLSEVEKNILDSSK